ncbi:MAG: hypothetical protein OEY89_10615 [Gammaproteobacteria bacterium]|nr:hypothetical protein [Gammaproteobacteria bacterium]
MNKFNLVCLTIICIFVSSCAANPTSPEAKKCRVALNAAYKNLDIAKANGFSGTVEYGKAAALLSAAKIQEEFGKYPNCIDKAERAELHIKKSMWKE